jgi:FAD/FMN-containing dehydrogenase
MNLHTRWEDPGKDKACIAWARDLFDAAGPHAASSIYVNFIPEEGEPDQVVAAYGDNLERLRQVKERYDPGNLFRVNHNIRPARAAVTAH